jgi:benzoyl-CoA-dihydrodiol lyase
MTVERFETHPDKYMHWRLAVDGQVATLTMDIQEDDSDRDYVRKMNSYDLFVDIELADAVNRLRFEHPEVKAVVVTSGKDRMFCAGANIQMLSTSSHAFKVNFCKFTNETRLNIEDASAHSDQKYIAACNGVASGGGYELALACDEIILVDDRSSAVSLPEVPLLGVLPGTGGLTRVVDKRGVRRDLADHFSSLAEGVRGRRAVEWRLIDATYKLSKFDEGVQSHVDAVLASVPDKEGAVGIPWTPLDPTVDEDGSRHYSHVDMELDTEKRRATLTVSAPEDIGPTTADEIKQLGMNWWPLKVHRQIDDCLLHLRLNLLGIGCIVIKTRGDQETVLRIDDVLEAQKDDWFVSEVRHYIKRTLKRLDYTAKTIFALADEGSAFAGTLFELAVAADRFFMLDDPDEAVCVALSPMNGGAYPMGNGLSRLETRFLGEPESTGRALETIGESLCTADAYDLGLVTFNPDDIDWDDEVRVALEERAHMSPDALTGMEANLRFAGPETLETKIFGRLSAWQNWIFQRPNAVGPEGALKSFGQPTSAKFNWERT